MNGQTIEGPGPWLELRDIKEMYVKNNGSEFVPPAPETESKEVLTFVHGWNMSPTGSALFAETLFKRLWHKGYRGRFAAYRWNTDWSDAFDNIPKVGEAVGAYLADYNGSEFTAWSAGAGLKQFVQSLPSDYRPMLTAHSMGNIVAGSALTQGLNVSKYVLLQAAVPASSFDDRQQMRENATYDHPIALLPDPTTWDEWSADDDYDPMAYRGKFAGIGGEPTSFFQINDHATSFAWEVNNDLTKPPGILAGNNHYLRTRPASQRCVFNERILTGYEALTKACRSWSKATGAKGETRGAIKFAVNNGDFSFGDEHSAEFNFRSQRCDLFYQELKIQLGIETP